MTELSLSAVRTSPAETTADVLVVGVLKGADGPTVTVELEGLPTDLAVLGVTGARDQLVRVPAVGVAASVVALVGLGDVVDAESLRYAAGSAVRQLTGVDRVALALPVADDDEAAAVLEGAAIASWEFDSFRSASAGESRRHARELVLVADRDLEESLVTRAAVVAEAVHTVRDLAMTPPQQMFPQALADVAVARAEGLPLTVTRTSCAPAATAASSGSGRARRAGLAWSRSSTRPRAPPSTSPSWARASPTTPAGSRSSRPAACSG
jgi:leucyl aminopeptidase